MSPTTSGTAPAGTPDGALAQAEGAAAACAHCHRPLRADARFCTACGQPVAEGATVTVVQGAQPRGRSDRADRDRADRLARREQPAVLPPSFGLAAPARPGRRVGAYAVDAVVVAAVGGAVLALTGSMLVTALAVVELGAGLVVWELRTGRTLGNLLLGLRTAREETPYAIGPARGLLRALVLAAGHAVAGLGQWVVVGSTALDRSGRAQGWHDRVGRAVVVDVRAHERAVDGAQDAAEAAANGAPGGTSGTSGPVRPGAGRADPSVPAVPAGRPSAASWASAGPAQPSPPGAVRPDLRPGSPASSVPSAPSSVGLGGGLPVPPPPVTPGPGHGTRDVTSASAAAGAVPTSAVPTVPVTPVTPVVPAMAPSEVRPATAARAEVAPYLVTLDTGRSMTVTGPGLIGRSPRPVAGEPCDHVVVIDDPERSVSRTHARFGIDRGTFWVSDAGSGNGTRLALPDGRVIAVPADQRVPVPSGGVIQVGDRTVTIHAPGAYPHA
ncbi:MAG TPA: RDD family protein [Cellulomonas sp.]